MKICTKCNLEKPTTDFAKNRSRKDGLYQHCKACDKKRCLEYRENNAEKVKAADKRYRTENRELINQKARERYAADPKGSYDRTRVRRRLRESFCTPEQYAELLHKQGGCCAICGKTERDNGKQLSADHCHNKKQMRGLLCQPCNLMLGHAKDSAQTLLKAIGYLKAHA